MHPMTHRLAGKQPSDKQFHQAMRVNHAGELGATVIYAGQYAVLNNNPKTQKMADLIQHMGEQEQVHLQAFNKLLPESGIRPTVLWPVWRLAGLMLGVGTALISQKAAMTCTEAVETVIDKHYSEQIEAFTDKKPELVQTLEQFRLEECQHRDTAIEQGSQQTPISPVLNAIIGLGCKIAIGVAKKI